MILELAIKIGQEKARLQEMELTPAVVVMNPFTLTAIWDSPDRASLSLRAEVLPPGKVRYSVMGLRVIEREQVAQGEALVLCAEEVGT